MMKTPNNNINLIKFLYKKYRQQGNIVYTDFLPESTPIPNTWTGTHPDLLIMSGNHLTAVCIETFDSLADEKVADKWKSFLTNPNVKLKIVIREEEELKEVKRIARANHIEIEYQRVKRTPPEKMKVRVKTRSKRALKVDWIIVITSIMILSVSTMLFGPMLIKLFKVKDFYRPMDAEGKIYQLDKTMKKFGR